MTRNTTTKKKEVRAESSMSSKISSTYSLPREKKEVINKVAKLRAINLNQLVENFLTAVFYKDLAEEGIEHDRNEEAVKKFLETNFPDFLVKN